MSNRTIDATTLAALKTSPIYAVWILRLDIQTDPVYINTSLVNMTFAGGSGYDPALVGFTFQGVGVIGSIDTITDSVDGSQSLNLTLPGVILTSDYLKQFVNNADLWQRYFAYLWLATCDSSFNLIGKPLRVKTARMSQLTMTIDPDNNTGTIVLALESQQAYSGDALFTRYGEQFELDSTDTSQVLSAAIANAVPGIGNSSTNPLGASQIAQNLVNRVAVGNLI